MAKASCKGAARCVAAASLALAAAACGRGGEAQSAQTETVHENSGATPAPYDGTAQVRLLGVDAGTFSSVRVKVKSIELRANGQLLDVAGLVDGIDLGVANQAWLLGTFKVPAGMDAVDMTVVFDAAGRFDTDSVQGTIDAGCTALRATLPANQLALRSHAVIHLDVGRSLVKTSEGAATLVPQFTLEF
jgi:hypothetical protein